MEPQHKAVRTICNTLLLEKGIPVKWIDSQKGIVRLYGSLISENDRKVMQSLGFERDVPTYGIIGEIYRQDESYFLKEGKLIVEPLNWKPTNLQGKISC